MANEKNNVTRDDKNRNNLNKSSSSEDASFNDEDKVLKEVEDIFNKKNYKRDDIQSDEKETDEGVDAEVFEHKEEKGRKKKKKDKKPSTYEKTTFAHKMKVLAVLTVLGVFTGSGLGVYYFNNYLRANVDYSSYNPADYIGNVDNAFSKLSITSASDKANWIEIAKGNGKAPSDLSPVDNLLLAEYNAKNATSYEIVGHGAVATIATQTVYSMRKFNGEVYTFESISKGMLNLAICDYMTKDKKTVDIYQGSNITTSGADWNLDKEGVTIKDYTAEAGTMPSDIQPYIISDKTVTSSTEVVYDDSACLYTFTIQLDPIKSVLYYYKQVKRTGGLEGDPEFEYVTITINIDENWNFVSTSIQEKYTAIKFGLRNTCVGTLNSTYKFNDEVTLPELNR